MPRPPSAGGSPTPSTPPSTCAVDDVASRFPARPLRAGIVRNQGGLSRPSESDAAIWHRRTPDSPTRLRLLKPGTGPPPPPVADLSWQRPPDRGVGDRKSTRLNSSHEWISYAVFCLKKKKNTN